VGRSFPKGRLEIEDGGRPKYYVAACMTYTRGEKLPRKRTWGNCIEMKQETKRDRIADKLPANYMQDKGRTR